MDYIGKLVQNGTFEKLIEPVALYFSYVDIAKYEYYKKHKELIVEIRNFCKRELAAYLKERKYPVVTDDSLLAAHLGAIVVSDTGIQTPFLEPEMAKDFGLELAEAVEKSGFAKPLSKIFAIRLEQLPPPVIHPQQEKTMFTYLRHPDGRILEYIRERYGKDFMDKLYAEAWKQGLDAEPKKRHKHQVEDLSEPLNSGRKLAIEAFYSYARNDMECKYEVFGTPSYKHAVQFCGGDDKFGLIHHFRKSERQLYYSNYAMETNGEPEKDPAKQLETVIVPGVNPYLGVEMYMGTRYYEIPGDEERWKVFLEYMRAAYIPKSDILRQRRLNILLDAKENGNRAVTYFPANQKTADLLMDKYQARQEKSLELEDVLITPATKIRKEYHDFIVNVERMTREVKEIKADSHKKTPTQTPETEKTTLNHNQER